MEQEEHTPREPSRKPATIDSVVEKLTYPETKTEYLLDKVVAGACMAAGFYAVTRGIPYTLNKLNQGRQYDRASHPTKK